MQVHIVLCNSTTIVTGYGRKDLLEGYTVKLKKMGGLRRECSVQVLQGSAEVMPRY